MIADSTCSLLEVYGESAYVDAETLDRLGGAEDDVWAKVPP